MHAAKLTLDFSDIRMSDLALVGGKNASLGEMFNTLKPKGVGFLDGFATTADAYRRLLAENGLVGKLRKIFSGLDAENVDELADSGHAARIAVLEPPLPADFRDAWTHISVFA